MCNKLNKNNKIKRCRNCALDRDGLDYISITRSITYIHMIRTRQKIDVIYLNIILICYVKMKIPRLFAGILIK